MLDTTRDYIVGPLSPKQTETEQCNEYCGKSQATMKILKGSDKPMPGNGE